MQVVIFADRLGQELAPLTERCCVGLLPIACKPVLIHVLEAVAAAGLRQVTVAVSPFAEMVQQTLGNGSRWGLRLNFVSTRGEEDPETVMRNQPRLEGDCLLLRGDVLHGATVVEFLRQARDISSPVVYGKTAEGAVDLCLHRGGGQGGLAPLRWSVKPAPIAPIWSIVELSGATVHRLDSLRAYYRANLAAAAGRISGLSLPGQQLAPKLTVGIHSKASPHTLQVGMALIGEHCCVDATAKLHGEVVISDGTVIDRRATLHNCVVLPHSWIGEAMTVRDAIVWGHQVIHFKNSSSPPVIESLLPTNLEINSPNSIVDETINRLLGLLLLALSLPLWTVAMAMALTENPKEPLHRLRLCGNWRETDTLGVRHRKVFVVWEWATSIPILRSLPRLLSVVSGDLRLIGVEPLPPEQLENRSNDWEKASYDAPVGLIGSSQLLLSANAPREQRSLGDAFQAQQRCLEQDARYFLQAAIMLFSPRAWRS